jgi:hypothetical protein
MMALNENRLAVVVTDGVRLFDVSDPLDPRDVGLVPAQGVRKVALAPSWLYALVDTDRRAGVVYAYSLVDVDAEPAAQFVPPSKGVTLETWGERVVVATDASGLYWLGVDEFVVPPMVCECLYLPVLSRH